MYSIDAEGAKERRKDLRRLRKLLRKESFAEDLEWFGRKVIDSEVPRKFEIAFATYLSLLIRVDNRLFLGRTFWNVKSPRVRLVHYLLMKRGYAETIIKAPFENGLTSQIDFRGLSKAVGFEGSTTLCPSITFVA